MKRAARGFTLIELMITVAVVAILSAIAYPSYQEYVLRSRRVEAQSLLGEAAARQERAQYLNQVADCEYLSEKPGDGLRLTGPTY